MASKAAKKRAKKQQSVKGWLKTLIHVGGGEQKTVAEIVRAMNETNARKGRAYRAEMTTFTDAGFTPYGLPPERPRPKAKKREDDPDRFASRREAAFWASVARAPGVRCWDDPDRVPLPGGRRRGGHFEADYGAG